jgi:hypothetical protein
VGSNNAFENHWRAEDTYAAAWANQMNSADGGFGPLSESGTAQHYPDALWMRLQRDGNFLITYRGSDGQTWTQMTRREFPNLAADLYVGPFFAPELLNNGAFTAGDPSSGIGHAVLAKFRNYTISTGAEPPPPEGAFTSITVEGGNIVIVFTGAGVQSARQCSRSRPMSEMRVRSPFATGAGKFYRIRP